MIAKVFTFFVSHKINQLFRVLRIGSLVALIGAAVLSGMRFWVFPFLQIDVDWASLRIYFIAFLFTSLSDEFLDDWRI